MQVMLDWVRLTELIENSPAAKEALGWVREMYAFSIAAAMQVCPVCRDQHQINTTKPDSTRAPEALGTGLAKGMQTALARVKK